MAMAYANVNELKGSTMDGTAKNAANLRELLGEHPRKRLAHLPTPFEFSKNQIAGHRFFIKRDDCTGLALGGNKVRKLEYALGYAVAAGADTLLTASGVQSNHVRQTAAAAALCGIPFHAVVAAAPALQSFPADYLDSGNILVDHIYGAILHLAEHEDLLAEKAQELATHLTAAGNRVYTIPLGASDGIGSLGYVECALEILAQAAETGADISHVFVPTGSGGTHAGLLAGFRLAGSSIKVIGISVSDPAPTKIEKVSLALADIEKVLDRRIELSENDICVFDEYSGPGYAVPTAIGNDAVIQAARNHGVLLDPTYTGKAWSGMADLLENGRLGEVRDVVFLHTGGQVGLFANPRLLFQTERAAPELAPLYRSVAKTSG